MTGAKPPGSGTRLSQTEKPLHALSCSHKTQVLKYIEKHMAQPHGLPLGKVVAQIVEAVIRDDAKAHDVTIPGVTDVR